MYMHTLHIHTHMSTYTYTHTHTHTSTKVLIAQSKMFLIQTEFAKIHYMASHLHVTPCKH